MNSEKTVIGFMLGAASNEGGIARVTSIIANHLEQTKNYEIHIISYFSTTNEGYGWSRKLNYHTLFKDKKPLKKRIINGSLKLHKLLKQNKISILVSCGALFGPLGVLATCLNNTKHVYWDHSNFFQDGDHNFELQGKKITAKFAHAVVPLTKTDKINYESFSKAKQITQIYNPVDDNLFNSPKVYNKNSQKIISIGRLGNQKNFLGLVEVAKVVLDLKPEWEWHIFGKGDQKPQIQNKINDLGLQGKLFLKGHHSSIYDAYPDYALLVMTSKYEGFPMSLLEGMAKGLPLISYDIPTGPNEIIKEGKNGFLIPFEDKEEMAKKIISLIENSILRENMSENQKVLVNEFKLNKIIEEWESLFRKILI
jgi:glycosyltransferase involved in cell wall biosynthesis